MKRVVTPVAQNFNEKNINLFRSRKISIYFLTQGTNKSFAALSG